MHRRHLLGLSLIATLGALPGCSTQPLGAVDDSQLSFDRTFNAAFGAMSDQKMVVGVQDRRNGLIVGTLNGDSITATLAPQHDGAIRVRFTQQGENNPELLKRVVDAYRRIRNTLRFLLANVSDFDPATDTVPEAELLEIDRWALSRAAQFQAEVLSHYQVYEFHPVVAKLQVFCSEDLGAFYLDVLKDRLYTTAPKSLARRSAQTALWQITHAMLRWMAPFLSFTAEEAWAVFQPGQGTIFLQTYWRFLSPDDALLAKWAQIRAVREAVNKAIEAVRSLHERLFYRPLLSAVAALPTPVSRRQPWVPRPPLSQPLAARRERTATMRQRLPRRTPPTRGFAQPSSRDRIRILRPAREAVADEVQLHAVLEPRFRAREHPRETARRFAHVAEQFRRVAGPAGFRDRYERAFGQRRERPLDARATAVAVPFDLDATVGLERGDQHVGRRVVHLP